MAFKLDRLTEDVRRELTDILHTLKDPRIGGLITIVRVDLTNDLSHCKVYVSSLEGIEGAKKAVEGLRSAAGYIRREIGHRVEMRRSPEFTFVADDSIEYSAGIAQKRGQLHERYARQDTEEQESK